MYLPHSKMERSKVEFSNPNIKIQMSNEAQMTECQNIFALTRKLETTHFPLLAFYFPLNFEL